MNEAIIEVFLAVGALAAALGVGFTCLLGLAVWLGGLRERQAKEL